MSAHVKFAWELPANKDDVQHMMFCERGSVEAVRVYVCVTAARTPALNLPLVKHLADAAGHHFVVVEFARELVPGTGLRFMRVDRFQQLDQNGNPIGDAALDRAELISSMAGFRIFENHDYKLKRSRPAVVGDILGYMLQLHERYPRFNEKSSTVIRHGNSMNCQGFAKKLVDRIREQHASVLRQLVAPVENVSVLASLFVQFKTPTHTSGVPNAASMGPDGGAPVLTRPRLF